MCHFEYLLFEMYGFIAFPIQYIHVIIHYERFFYIFLIFHFKPFYI